MRVKAAVHTAQKVLRSLLQLGLPRMRVNKVPLDCSDLGLKISQDGETWGECSA